MGKKWSKEECRIRYVEGDRIGLEALAIESGVSFGTLKRWASQKPGTWFEQRKQFDEKTILLSNQKSRERISEAMAQSNEAAVSAHLEILATMREIATFFFEAVMTKVREIEKDGDPDTVNDELLEFLKSISGRVPLQTYSNVLHVAIQGERQALYLDLADPTILERAANRQGLSLVNLEVVENLNNA